ncbi:MAG: superoxide dismutase, Ni [Candidatus Altiarchaeota archaeon]|nr:superoxide dismutase, Ni [Candidatus Altiarchaeota archaeon]
MLKFSRGTGFRKVHAHCDVPCGIYDTYEAQVCAHTIIRMVGLIEAIPEPSKNEHVHRIARYTKVKEDHAEKLKQEVRILYGDYFKENHFKENSELNSLILEILKLASKTKQEINTSIAQTLLNKTQKLAEIFYKTKGLETLRIPSTYPTGGEIVVHKSPAGEGK